MKIERHEEKTWEKGLMDMGEGGFYPFFLMPVV